MRLATKPGTSVRRMTGSRPMRRVTSAVIWTGSSEVSGPCTTSTSRITSGGEEKGMLTHLSGRRAGGGGAAAPPPAEPLLLRPEPLHDRLDHKVGVPYSPVQVGLKAEPV